MFANAARRVAAAGGVRKIATAAAGTGMAAYGAYSKVNNGITSVAGLHEHGMGAYNSFSDGKIGDGIGHGSKFVGSGLELMSHPAAQASAGMFNFMGDSILTKGKGLDKYSAQAGAGIMDTVKDSSKGTVSKSTTGKISVVGQALKAYADKEKHMENLKRFSPHLETAAGYLSYGVGEEGGPDLY
ncbi:MAG: hypothetical protein ORN50_08280 [Crocinitomicaceae bacterium]|jgi:hypothetical protein|nr:hypothetical protein [Crocinitomicaceae bacterium]